MTGASTAARPRGWYHGWNVVAVCILSQVAANGLTYNSFSLFLPGWSAQLHAPISRLQLAVTAMVLPAALLSPWIGALADRLPARRLFACGLLGMAVFYVAISGVTAAWQILALYGLLAPVALGLATAIPANTVISRWFVRRLGLALGLSAFGIGMAGVVLPPLVSALLPVIGWRMIWRIGGAVLAFVVAPIVVLTIRDRPRERDGLHYVQPDTAGSRRAPAHGAGGAEAAGKLSWRDVLARRNFWLLVAVYIPMLGLYGACSLNLAPYAESRGLSQQVAGGLIAVLSLAHVVATLLFGLISDRFGNRGPFAVLALIMVAGGVGLAFGAGLPLIAVACALIGVGGGLYTLLSAALAVEFGMEGFGRAYGMSMLFVPLGPLSAFAVAWAEERTGSYAPGFLAMTALVLVSGGLALLLRERRGGHPTEAESAAAAEEAITPLG